MRSICVERGFLHIRFDKEIQNLYTQYIEYVEGLKYFKDTVHIGENN